MISLVPSLLLKQLYNRGSLKNTNSGVEFGIKNRLADVEIKKLSSVKIDGREFSPESVSILFSNNTRLQGDQVGKINAINFPLRDWFTIEIKTDSLPDGKHELEVSFTVSKYGALKVTVEDSISSLVSKAIKVPRDDKDDYSETAIKNRQNFIEKQTGVRLNHINQYSFDPHITAGNCEHFMGVAQVPLGIAGPLTINGEHAQGDFWIPMATAEGTLVASYNRGMKVINQSGGVKCTVQDDVMQRAPVFVFEDARGARDFVAWVLSNFAQIAAQADATTSVGKLKYIDPFLASKFAYLRFNFTTGDAAGQNMVGRATFAACSWILDVYKEHRITNFYLESNLATDKKASQINVMRTRGKRVTAEVTVPRDVLIQNMRVEPEKLVYHAMIANVGAILSGANNNGLHSANGITALFIATGQDVANVAESSAGIVHSEITANGDFYFSITIPSLIIATHGGGVGLATQNESLAIMDCVGKGKVKKLAEIIAGVVLAGELSLGAAISSSDWVSSHEQYGRNR